MWFKRKLQNIKLAIKGYFKLDNLINNLENLLTKTYVISMNLDQIYYGTKNPKRFKLCIFN